MKSKRKNAIPYILTLLVVLVMPLPQMASADDPCQGNLDVVTKFSSEMSALSFLDLSVGRFNVEKVTDSILVSYMVNGIVVFSKQQPLFVDEYLGIESPEITPIVGSGGYSGLLFFWQWGRPAFWSCTYIMFYSSTTNQFYAEELPWTWVRDLDNDGETELIVKEHQDWSSDFAMCCQVFWDNIYHILPTGQMISVNEQFPEYYAEELNYYREEYNFFTENKYLYGSDYQYIDNQFIDFIKRMENLAGGDVVGQCRGIDAVMPTDICTGICPSVVFPYASLSAASYGDSILPTGWRTVYDTDQDTNPVGVDFVNFLSGFHAVLYEDTITKKRVLAFQGTDGIQDQITDLIQLVSQYPPLQYISALILVDEILKNDDTGLNTKDNLVLTGHSLGGGLAQFVARKLGLTAYTFNPAGLFPGTYAYGDHDSTARITNIVTITASMEPLWPSDVVSNAGKLYGNTLQLPVDADYILFSPWGLFGEHSLHGTDIIVSTLRDLSAQYNSAYLPRFFSNMESVLDLPAHSYVNGPSSAGMYMGYTNTNYGDYGDLHIEVRNGDVFYTVNHTLDNLVRIGTLNETNSYYCGN